MFVLTTLGGLPVHPLIVHATVVAVPAAAAAVITAGVWPRFRRWAGWGPLALSVVAVALTPLSTSSGESLEEQVGHSSLVEQHSRLADMMIWWVVPLALFAAGQYWLHAHRGSRRHPRAGVRIAVMTVLPALVALGTLVQVVLVGHSGARAAWSDVGATSARGHSPGPSDDG